MDMERTPERCEQQSDKTDKTNTHWDEWEFACLLNRVLEGWEFEPIGVGLRRTAAACKRMLARLLDGETPCPERYKPILEEVRGKFPPETKRRTGAKANDDRIIEQYKTLARGHEAIADLLRQMHTALDFLLALAIIEGGFQVSEIFEFTSTAQFQTVQNMVRRIRQYRKEHEPNLFNKPAQKPPTSENPQSEIRNSQSEGAAK